MAPTTTRGQREPSVEETSEYQDFIKELAAYHEKRGTNFDPQPRVNNRRVDLLRLYQNVLDKGGYDVVSAKQLLWRTVGQEFSLGATNLPALAFNLKTVYYKNLAAYEISTVHNQVPPPKEILEDLTAKGGDLLHRTLDNFKRPTSRESGSLVNGHDTGSGDEGQRTPKEDRMDMDDPGSGGRTRSLRQQPPQRVLWQPDTAPARPRNVPTHTNSPQPQGMPTNYPPNPSSDPTSAMFNIQSWEGSRRPHALTTQHVITPSNNPDLFRQRKMQELRHSLEKVNPLAPINPRPLKSGFSGPNIYVRCLNGLRCPIPQEQEFALHHLVKVSHERGDKFKFQSFQGLAEALVKKGLEISSLFYNVKWDVVFDEDSMVSPNCLNGAVGTDDILSRIEHFPPCNPADDVRTSEWQYKLERMNETGLIIRNLIQLEENAHYLAKYPLVKDLICIGLNLPNEPRCVEFKTYVLDITEQLIKYWVLTPALWESLVRQLVSSDQGILISALQCINRASMELETNNNLAGPVPMSTISHLMNLIYRDDEELVGACMDFLYQFTANADHVEEILNQLPLSRVFIPRLISLLTYGAYKVQGAAPMRPTMRKPSLPVEIPEFPKDLIVELAKFPEPDRSVKWLECCFEENEETEVTQIHLWQSYQNCFAEYISPANPMLPASEFIKRVSTTFNGATAQVINTSEAPRFIIKGIQPRKHQINLDNRVILRCPWEVDGKQCGDTYYTDEEGRKHVAKVHLDILENEQGEFSRANADTPRYVCHWPGCNHPNYKKPTENTAAMLSHVQCHFAIKAELEERTEKAEKDVRPTQTKNFVWYYTQQDERNQPAGLALTSVLNLKNLARYASRVDEEDQVMEKMFGAVKPTIIRAWAHNISLNQHLTDLVMMMDGQAKRKA